MALTILTGSSQAAATNYSYTTSGSADWASVPTASYFYDITDKTVRFKATNSTYSNIATASLALTASNVTGTVTSASYAATASYSSNLQISGSINNVNYIDFNTGSVVTQPVPGRLSWNDTDGTLDIGLKGGNVTLQIGQEEVARVVNKTGANLLESQYRAVRVRSVAEGGAQGQRLAVVLAQANNDANSATTIGVVTEDINVNQDGFITISGQVRGINTTGTLQGETWADGDVLYLSPTTPGHLTNVKPQAPQHTVIVGYVEYAHNNQGKIYVKIDNGYEIDELHNVLINTGSLASGQLLIRSGSVWTNSNQLSGSYGLTGSLTATSFTGSLQGTASFATSASYASTASLADFALSANTAGTTSDATSIASAITNNTDNYLLTATGTGIIDAESLLTFDGTTLTAIASVVQGEGGSAVGLYSHVEGTKNNAANGDFSHAEGDTTTAGGNYSHTEGVNTTTDSNAMYSHAEGQGTLTFGTASHAEGQDTQANGQASHAEGYTTNAKGGYSHAEGNTTTAYGNYSHTEGNTTQAGSDQGYLAAAVEGKIQLNADYGDVTSEYNPGDIILLDDFAFENNYGVQTFTVGNASWDGTNTTITTNEPLSTDCPVVIGNITYGVQIWSGGNSIGGQYAHAEGGSTFAIGIGSHAEGDSTETYGRVSHAQGEETKAIGEYSHAEGYQTQAIGVGSHAEGYSTQAIGNYSHAEGLSTIASGSYQHVSGQFNTHGDTTSLFIVGNGVDNATRSDAFKVTPSGSIVLPNTINDAPSWTGTQGEMVFYDNGVGTYRIFVWLGGEWRKADLT